MTSQPSARGATLGLIARAAAEAGDAVMFDMAVAESLRLLDAGHQPTMFFNPFSLQEIRIRGLLATGRVSAAVALVEAGTAALVRLQRLLATPTPSP